METSNPIMPPLQNIGIPKIETNTIEKVKTFLSNKRNLGIISVIIIGCLYFAYKKNLLNFIIKKGQETEKIEEANDNLLDIDKYYNILDENNNPTKINLKEMILLHKHYLEQERITLENHQKHIQQQQMMQQQMMKQQMMQQQMQQQQMQQQQQQQQKNRKIKHPKQEVDEDNSEELTNNELELLKRELAELELQNQNID